MLVRNYLVTYVETHRTIKLSALIADGSAQVQCARGVGRVRLVAAHVSLAVAHVSLAVAFRGLQGGHRRKAGAPVDLVLVSLTLVGDAFQDN